MWDVHFCLDTYSDYNNYYNVCAHTPSHILVLQMYVSKKITLMLSSPYHILTSFRKCEVMWFLSLSGLFKHFWERQTKMKKYLLFFLVNISPDTLTFGWRELVYLNNVIFLYGVCALGVGNSKYLLINGAVYNLHIVQLLDTN